MRTESHGKPSKVKRKSSWWHKYLFETSMVLELLWRTCHLFCFVSGLKVCAEVQPHTNNEAFSLLNCKLPAAEPVKDSNTSPVFYVSTCHTSNKTRRTFKNNVITKTMLCLLSKINTFGCVWFVSAMVTRYVEWPGTTTGVLLRTLYSFTTRLWARCAEDPEESPIYLLPQYLDIMESKSVIFHGFSSFCSVAVLNAQR